MHFLVTGCAGFIGSHLCDKLLDMGHKVSGIDNFDPFYPRNIKESNLERATSNAAFHLFEGDIQDIGFLDSLPVDIDFVIHLAAKAGVRPSVENPQGYIDTNVTGTHRMLEWMRRRSLKKLVFASSSSVYGNNKRVPFSETDVVDYPISPYAFTKKTGELITHTYHHLYGMDVINLRFFTVYGPRQRPDLAIRKFTELILNDKPITLYGDGSTSRDYTYIDDIVDGVCLAIDYLKAQQNVYETINLGNSSPVSLAALVEHIYLSLRTEPKIQHTQMQEGDVHRTYADTHKAKSLLGFEARTSLRDGLKSFIAWYRTQ